MRYIVIVPLPCDVCRCVATPSGAAPPPPEAKDAWALDITQHAYTTPPTTAAAAAAALGCRHWSLRSVPALVAPAT